MDFGRRETNGWFGTRQNSKKQNSTTSVVNVPSYINNGHDKINRTT